MQHDSFGHATPLAPVSALYDVDGIIKGIITFLRSRYSKWGTWFLIMWCHLHWHHMTPIALSMSYGTDPSNGTSTSTKGHIIPLINHQHNKCNGVTDDTICIMLLPCRWQKLLCSSNAIYKPQMPISSCPHMTLLCQYVCLLWTHYDQQCE